MQQIIGVGIFFKFPHEQKEIFRNFSNSTAITLPTLHAREKPIGPSKCEPDDIFFLSIFIPLHKTYCFLRAVNNYSAAAGNDNLRVGVPKIHIEHDRDV